MGPSDELLASLHEEAQKVKNICELVEAMNAKNAKAGVGLNIEKLKELMGAENVFGPEAYKEVFGVDVGQVPELPENLEAILQEDCPFTKGKRVAETHQLVLVPEKLNGKDFTIMDLRGRANEKNGSSFRDENWYNKKDFANRASEEGSHWSLVYKELLPNSKGKGMTDKGQLDELAKYPDYETTPAIDQIVDLELDFLRNGNRRHKEEYGRLDDRSSNGYRVYVGGFGSSGLDVDDNFDGRSDSYLGRFVRRKLNN